jgi:O-antigen ligase
VDRARVKSPIGSQYAFVLLGLVAAAGLGLFTAVNPTLGLALFLGLVALVGFSRSATFGVCTFTFATFFEIAAQSPALSPIKLTGGALFIVAFATLAMRRRPAGFTSAGSMDAEIMPPPAWRTHPAIVGSLLLLVLWAAASASWARDIGQVWSLGSRLATDALVFFAIGVLIVSLRQLQLLAWTTVIAAVASAGVGLVRSEELAGRALGTFTDPNDFAAALAPAIAVGFGAVLASNVRWQRVAGGIGIAACIMALLSTQSRGGLVSLGVVAVLIVVTSRGRERIRMLGAVALMIALAAMLVGLTPQGQGLLDRLEHNDSSGRTDLWRVALNMAERHPVTGVGLGNYPVLSDEYLTSNVHHVDLFVGEPRTTHDSPLEILAELGVVGFSLFYGFVGGCVFVCMRALRLARRLDDPPLEAIGRGILAGMLGALASGIFLSGQYQELLWVLLASGVAYAAVVRRAVLARAAATLHAGG